jgi:uncharacterized protein YcfL
MKKITSILLLISMLCLTGCESSSDDNVDSVSILPNVTIISNDVDNLSVFQTDITDNGEGVITSNLTEQIGLPLTYTVSYENEVLSIFERVLTENTYKVHEKHVNTGELSLYENICTPTTENFRAFRHSDQKIIVFTLGALGSNIYIQDKNTGECLTLNISDEFLTNFGTSRIDNEVIYLY